MVVCWFGIRTYWDKKKTMFELWRSDYISPSRFHLPSTLLNKYLTRAIHSMNMYVSAKMSISGHILNLFSKDLGNTNVNEMYDTNNKNKNMMVNTPLFLMSERHKDKISVYSSYRNGWIFFSNYWNQFQWHNINRLKANMLKL